MVENAGIREFRSEKHAKRPKTTRSACRIKQNCWQRSAFPAVISLRIFRNRGGNFPLLQPHGAAAAAAAVSDSWQDGDYNLLTEGRKQTNYVCMGGGGDISQLFLKICLYL